MLPEHDGITHINIYSKASTQLGRFLSNFHHTPINIPDAGTFNSIEGYWYWLSTQEEILKSLYGYKAKQVGKSLPRKVNLSEEEFKKKIYEACWIKLHMRPDMLQEFIDSTLPFAHYYVFGGKVVNAGGWIVEMWELFRKHLKGENI